MAIAGGATAQDESLPAGATAVAAGLHRLPDGCRIALADSESDVRHLESQWRRLEESARPAARFFQGYAWLGSWIGVHGKSAGKLHIVTGYRGEELVFAWPLMAVRVGPIRVLRWLTEPHGQYGDVLVAPGQCPRAWLESATAMLRQSRRFDVIRLRHVRDDSNVAPFLTSAFRSANFHESAPWLDLTQFPDEAAYEARYTSSQRKRRKKIRKRLESAFGPVKFEVLTQDAAVADAIEQAIAEKCAWIEERGLRNAVLCCSRLAGFLTAFARSKDRAAQVTVSRMTAGGRAVSWEVGVRSGGVHFCFMTSHVNRLTDYSPARLHMDFSQRQALKDGMKAFDLMVPYDPYKESWSSAAVMTSDYYLPLTAVGGVYGQLYLERLRPMIRRVYYGMPSSCLKLLKHIIRH